MELETSRCWEAGEQSPAKVDLNSISGTIHLIGIGGIGMSALARLLLAEGKKVSGSDKEANSITAQLEQMGAKIFVGHDAKNVQGAEIIVVSTAITDANPELKAATERKLPVIHRSALLEGLTCGKSLIAISGTHGKTTTTGMVAQLFLDNDTDPTIVVGGVFERVGSNSRHGNGKFFIAEADESDRTHASLKSSIAVVTNIEADHLENYPGGMDEIFDNMVSFANHSTGCIIVCLDDPGCQKVMPKLKGKIVTYGSTALSPKANFRLESTGSQSFNVYQGASLLGEIQLAVPGHHNKLNALAAIVCAMECGLSFDQCAESLEKFGGVARRFQILGTKGGITVVDDYGHHPTEVRATLEAAQQYKTDNDLSGRVVAVFQPHQPGRLRDLWDDFCQAFDHADLLLLTDVYIARGSAIDGIDSERFAKAVQNCESIHVPGPVAELPDKLIHYIKDGDLVLTIGAGDITRVGPELLKRLG